MKSVRQQKLDSLWNMRIRINIQGPVRFAEQFGIQGLEHRRFL